MAINIKLSGVGTYLPGDPIDFDEINHYLGEFQEAPKKIKNWAGRVQPIIKEMLGINQCYYAFDNETRTFTDDNLTMSVKAAKKENIRMHLLSPPVWQVPVLFRNFIIRV